MNMPVIRLGERGHQEIQRLGHLHRFGTECASPPGAYRISGFHDLRQYGLHARASSSGHGSPRTSLRSARSRSRIQLLPPTKPPEDCRAYVMPNVDLADPVVDCAHSGDEPLDGSLWTMLLPRLHRWPARTGHALHVPYDPRSR